MSAEVGLNKYEEVKTVPVVDLVFTSSKRSLIDRVSDAPLQFTRNTIGTYVDENGIIQTAAAGEPRYTYDLMTGESLGLLIEESRTNLLTYSEGPNWSSTGATGSVNFNAFTSPDGNLNAVEILGEYTDFVTLPTLAYNFGGPFIVEYDLVSKTIDKSQTSFGGYVTAYHTPYIEEYSNGWFRIVDVPRAYNTEPIYTFSIFVKPNGATTIKTIVQVNQIKIYVDGTSTTGAYFWGAQMEGGVDIPSSYIPTSGSTVTRDPDTVTLTNNNLYNNSEFDIINQPFGVAAGSNTLQLFPSDKPIKRVSVFSPNLTQTRVNQFAEKEDEFWKWRVLGSSFGLPNFLTDGQVTVDWGDGTIETLTTSDHTFTNGGGYHDIGFRLDSGTYFRPKIGGNAAVGDKIYSVGPAPESMKVDATQLFWNCDNLKSVDATFDIVNSANSAFYLCDNLKNIPKVNTTGITDFTNFARECNSLTSFPLLDTSSGTFFNAAWRDCNSLTSFPLLDTSNCTNFNNTWRNCSSLTSFPLLNTSSGVDFNGAWRGCDSLTSFPLLDTSNSTNFNGAWRGCNSLTSFPLLDTSSGTGFNSTWRNCNSLTSFPLLDTSSGTGFNGAWASCSSLSDFPANLFDSWTATPSNGCFIVTWFDCPLTPTSVENIINSISISPSSFNPPPIDTEITIDYNAASGTPDITVPAVDLIAKGWIPTLNGSAKNDAYSSDFATLDLDFATNLSLTDNISGNNLVTFSRNSIGTYVDSNGVIQTAAIDTARFDHDPLTNESLGLLVEESRANLFTYSKDFSLGWSPNQVTLSTNQGIAPDGTNTAALVTTNTSFTYKILSQTPTLSVNTDYCYSVFVKLVSGSGTSTRFVFGSSNTLIDPFYASYGLQLDNLSETRDGTLPSVKGYVEYPNGWYRIYMSINTLSQTNAEVTLRFGDPSDDNIAEFLIWGAQLESGSFPTSYIPTPATFISRASSATYYDANGIIQTALADVARDDAYFPDENGVFRPAGLLLEAAGTNLCIQSETFTTAPWTTFTANVSITANQLDPAGGSTASLITHNAGTSRHRVAEKISTTRVSRSFYIKKTNQRYIYVGDQNSGNYSPNYRFDLDIGVGTVIRDPFSYNYGYSITKVANNFYRIWVDCISGDITQIVASNTLSNTGTNPLSTNETAIGTESFIIWGYQVESGTTYPTSYIPTAGSTVTRAADVSSSSTVTRAADVVSITGTNFSSWYNQNEGTVFAELQHPDIDGNKAFVSLSGSGTEKIAWLTTTGSSQIRLDNPTIFSRVFSPQEQANTKTKVALSFKDSPLSSALDGSPQTGLTYSGSLPTIDSLHLGGILNYHGSFNSTISRLTYWPKRLTDKSIQFLSQ